MNNTDIKAQAFDKIADIFENGCFDERHIGAVCGIIDMTDEITRINETAHTIELEPKTVLLSSPNPKGEPTVSKQETVDDELDYALSEEEEETFRELMEEKPYKVMSEPMGDEVTDEKPKSPPSKKEGQAKASSRSKSASKPDSSSSVKTDYTGASKPKKDLGKLKACLDAGRSVKWLADEFGVTDQTIRNWKKELES